MTSGRNSTLGIIIAIPVVILIAAFLYPMVAPRRPYGGKSKCLNNLKQLSQALKMYCDDFDGGMPSSYLVSHSKQWNRSDSLRFGTVCGRAPTEAASAGPGSQSMRNQTLREVLYDWMKSPDIVFCPSDPVDQTDPNSQTSYWYKLANDKAWYGVGCKAPCRSMTDYAYESDQVAFYERLGWHFGDTTGLKNGIQVNMSFIDTHVSTIMISHATSGDPINCAVNSNGEPMYYNTAVDPKTNTAKTDPGPARHTDPTQCYDNF